MNDPQNIHVQRLADSIARLASILVETTAARVREQMPAATTPKTIPVATPAIQYVQKPIDNLMTKRDVTE
jgi:hypothetical protein